MRRVVFSSVACPGSANDFPRYLTNGTNFGKKIILEDKMCFLIFCTILSEKFLILRGIERNIVINVWKYLCQVPPTAVIF
jgi:hypothetical protein